MLPENYDLVMIAVGLAVSAMIGCFLAMTSLVFVVLWQGRPQVTCRSYLIMPRTDGVSCSSETELTRRRPRPRTVAR